MRDSGRLFNEIRKISFIKDFTKYAEGSVLICFGETKVLCNVSVVKEVPKFICGFNQGWVTAEYSLLPRSTNFRVSREAVRGQQSSRTKEIQRLIGRALRAIIDLSAIPGYTFKVDCDVIQADGGTRTAAITGANLAIKEAVKKIKLQGLISDTSKVMKQDVAAISVGMCKGRILVDLDYKEDSNADSDVNFVITKTGEIIEIQGTAEKEPFSEKTFFKMYSLAQKGINDIFKTLS